MNTDFLLDYVDLASLRKNEVIHCRCLIASLFLMIICSFYSIFTPYLFYDTLKWLCPLLAFSNSIIFGYSLNKCITLHKIGKLTDSYKPLFRESWLSSSDKDKMVFLKNIGFVPSVEAPLQVKNFLFLLGINFESYADILSYCFKVLIVNKE